jgi:hypothetical protein
LEEVYEDPNDDVDAPSDQEDMFNPKEYELEKNPVQRKSHKALSEMDVASQPVPVVGKGKTKAKKKNEN